MRGRQLTRLPYIVILFFVIGCSHWWVDQLDRDAEENRKFFNEYTLYKEEGFNVNTFTNRIDTLYDEAKSDFPKSPKEEHEASKAEGKIEMTFVHLSDVQIRDERVKLFGKNVSRILDNVIPSFEHGERPEHDMEHYDYAAYLAIIRTINALVEGESVSKPKFMIHTGDAVDASVVEELFEFIYISNKLKIPWYNVLGNHDVTVFGNFNNKKVYVNDPNLTFQTLHNQFNFINMHGGGHLVDPNINAGPPAAEHLMGQTGSRYHGFDLCKIMENKKYKEDNKYLCRECPGYYSFKLRKTDGDYEIVPPKEETSPPNSKEIVCIVLNTTTTRLGFAKGTVDDKQLDWLKGQLEENKEKLLLVFGHHPLDGPNFMDNSYEKLIGLFHDYHVIAYFCGHTHAHQIRCHEKKGKRFYEVITDSILEYPQEGSLVTIRNLGNGTGALDIRSFKKNITNKCQLQEEADLAFKDAEEDKNGHLAEIADKDRNARLTFNHPYFSD